MRDGRGIHAAVLHGPDALESFAKFNVADLDERDDTGRTPLMLSCGDVSRNFEVFDEATSGSCEWLLGNGADPALRDDDGRTALHWAAHNYRLRCIDALIEAGAPIDARDHRGRTPLMLALLGPRERDRDRASTVELLLRHGADANARDDHGWTPLHVAAAALYREEPLRTIEWLLARHGARSQVDHAGRLPADLRACRLERFDEDHPLAPRREPDLASQPRELEPKLVERLLAELVPEPFDPTQPNDCWARGALEPWTVLADWLQTQGDPRGEVVAASLARTRVGGRKRWALREHQRRVASRAHSLLHFATYRADPLAPISERSFVQTQLAHGFVRAAFISLGRFRGNFDAQRICHAAATMLRFEPLLAELRLRPPSHLDWPELIDRLSKLPPAPRLRRLVLDKLPGKLPDLAPLVPVFPGLRSLCLVGAAKIQSGLVRWPGIKHLRIRHGKNNTRLSGLFDLTLDFPDLTHLDLGLPPGAPFNNCENSESELEGAVATLNQFPYVSHLRLCPLRPEFAAVILPCGLLRRVRTLELVRVHGDAFEHLLRHAARLREPERVCIAPQPKAHERRAAEIERLRELVPGLVIDHRTRLRRRRRGCAWSL